MNEPCTCGHSKNFHYFGKGNESPYLRECIDNYARPNACNCKGYKPKVRES